jgi:hypothetical protein
MAWIERAVQLIADLACPLDRDVDVHAPARETLAHAPPHGRLQLRQLRAGADVHIEETIVDGLQVHGDAVSLALRRAPPEPGHGFHKTRKP